MNSSLCAVRIAGATGHKELHINGCYEPMEEIFESVRVFRKLGGEYWLVYSQGTWLAQSTSFKGTNKCFAYVTSPLRPPQLCDSWQVSTAENVFEPQQLSVTAMSQVSPFCMLH